MFKCKPNKGVVPPRFGVGPQFSYAGWSSMKTLVDKSLIVRKNCPTKYVMLEQAYIFLHLLFSAFASLQTFCIHCSNILASKFFSFLDFENH
jgi:hypothetical protein